VIVTLSDGVEEEASITEGVAFEGVIITEEEEVQVDDGLISEELWLIAYSKKVLGGGPALTEK
jgi:hypothetical protein